MEDHHRISTVNHHIRDQLSAEQDKAYRTEETLKVDFYFIISLYISYTF